MNINITKRIGASAACLVLTAGAVVGVGLGEASAAPASFDGTQASWKDCGPVYCTRYYSIEQSEINFSNTQSLVWGLTRTAHSGMNWLAAAITHKDQATLDGLEEAANDAVHSGGCLQFQWRKDGKGRGKWGSTTHPNYCFHEYPKTYTDRNGNTFYYDPATNTYATRF